MMKQKMQSSCLAFWGQLRLHQQLGEVGLEAPLQRQEVTTKGRDRAWQEHCCDPMLP